MKKYLFLQTQVAQNTLDNQKEFQISKHHFTVKILNNKENFSNKTELTKTIIKIVHPNKGKK